MDAGAPLTTGDVATVCHVSQVTVFRWIKRGFLKAYTTPGGHFRIRGHDLADFLSRQGMPVPPDLAEKSNRRCVLLVDDDPLVLETVRKILSRDVNLDIETASGGYEACIKIGVLKPDLIILDLLMPMVDGFAVMREVRKNPETNTCKIMILSGYCTDENLTKAHEQGADRFLSKPVEAQELLNCVKSLVFPAVSGGSPE